MKKRPITKEGLSSLALALLTLLSFILTILLIYDTISVNGIFNRARSQEELGTRSANSITQPAMNYFQTTEQTYEDVIRPTRAYLRQDDQFYSLLTSEAMDRINDFFKNYPLQTESISQFRNEKVYNDLFGQDYFQVNLPASMPLSSLESILSIEGGQGRDLEVDMIMIPLDDSHSAYLLNSRDKTYIRMALADELSIESVWDLINPLRDQWIVSERYPAKEAYVYLPIDPIKLESQHFLLEKVPDNPLIYRTFPDSDYRRLESTESYKNIFSTIEYSLELNNMTSIMKYTVTNVWDDNNPESVSRMYSRFYQTVSEYEFWPFDLRMTRSNSRNLVFRRYLNNFPIYSQVNQPNQAASIVRTANYLKQLTYEIPLLRPQMRLTHLEEEFELLAASDLSQELTRLGYQLNDFEDIFIGYEWQTHPEEADRMRLYPTWYFKYKGSFYPLQTVQSPTFRNLYTPQETVTTEQTPATKPESEPTNRSRNYIEAGE